MAYSSRIEWFSQGLLMCEKMSIMWLIYYSGVLIELIWMFERMNITDELSVVFRSFKAIDIRKINIDREMSLSIRNQQEIENFPLS